uniref:Uncharacterized protein n=1 Tax=Glossina palpalis gambiensis TaxID=67801 RepID=A0A1B0BSI5_9MUSC
MHSVQSAQRTQSRLSRRLLVAAFLPNRSLHIGLINTCQQTVPKRLALIHGVVVSNLSLVLLQKEYIKQFYFEKRNGGGGPDLAANELQYTSVNCSSSSPKDTPFKITST